MATGGLEARSWTFLADEGREDQEQSVTRILGRVTVVSHFISPLLAENRSIQESLRQALGPVSKVLECSSSVPATERLS